MDRQTYYEVHKEKIKADKKRWRATHKEEQKAYNKTYREANKEKYAAYNKIWNEVNKEKLQVYREANKQNKKIKYIYKTYGITQEQYEVMLKSQNGCCKICGKPETKKDKSGTVCSLAIDHVHVDGFDELQPEEKAKYVRGLLCYRCNMLLGYSNDSYELLESAITYLKGCGRHGKRI